jgi:hypothetical protein
MAKGNSKEGVASAMEVHHDRADTLVYRTRLAFARVRVRLSRALGCWNAAASPGGEWTHA